MPVMHAVMFCLFSPLVIDGKSKSQWIMVGVRLHMVKGKLTADYVER